jgi:hypothetical protein
MELATEAMENEELGAALDHTGTVPFEDQIEANLFSLVDTGNGVTIWKEVPVDIDGLRKRFEERHKRWEKMLDDEGVDIPELRSVIMAIFDDDGRRRTT